MPYNSIDQILSAFTRWERCGELFVLRYSYQPFFSRMCSVLGRSCNRMKAALASPTVSYDSLSREQLIEELHLRDAQSAASGSSCKHGTPLHERAHRLKRPKKSPSSRNDDKYGCRLIALRLSYLGFEYAGFARQENTTETIEGYLMHALERANLLPPEAALARYKSAFCEKERYESPEHELSNAFASKYHYTRCGRTDRGVSAFGQVVSLLLRSKTLLFPPNSQVDGDVGNCIDKKSQIDEMPYDLILNGFLPPSIRVLSWAFVPPRFSARFDCTSRTYKYIFSEYEFSYSEKLNVALMEEACKAFIGHHYFKHFCKYDPKKPNAKYDRTIDHSEISEFASIDLTTAEAPISSEKLYVLTLSGRGFLYHQVRCMMGVLYRIGRGLDPPSIIEKYYDISLVQKPSYEMASEFPLILWDCAFDGPEDACGSHSLPPIKVVWNSEKTLVSNSCTDKSNNLMNWFWKSFQDYSRKSRAAFLMFHAGLVSSRALPQRPN